MGGWRLILMLGYKVNNEGGYSAFIGRDARRAEGVR